LSPWVLYGGKRITQFNHETCGCLSVKVPDSFLSGKIRFFMEGQIGHTKIAARNPAGEIPCSVRGGGHNLRGGSGGVRIARV